MILGRVHPLYWAVAAGAQGVGRMLGVVFCRLWILVIECEPLMAPIMDAPYFLAEAPLSILEACKVCVLLFQWEAGESGGSPALMDNLRCSHA